MFELKYASITNPALTDAMTTLMAHKGFPTKTAYNLARIEDKLDQASKRIREEYTVLARKHGMIDEKGIPLKDLSAEKQQAWQGVHESFDEKTFKIDRNKIQVSEIEDVGLTPQMLFAIADFVEGLEGKNEKVQNKKTQVKEVRA